MSPNQVITQSSDDNRNFNATLMYTLGNKYDSLMRRSVQSAILFQAGDDVEKQYSNLKIFQRKLMLFEAAHIIIESLNAIPLEERKKLLYRTTSRAIVLSPELAWRRYMYTKRETEKILQELRTQFATDKPHSQICDEYVQAVYEKRNNGVYNGESNIFPRNWEFSHLKEFIIFRMFHDRKKLLHFRSAASVNLQYNPTRALAYSNGQEDESNEAEEVDETPIIRPQLPVTQLPTPEIVKVAPPVNTPTIPQALTLSRAVPVTIPIPMQAAPPLPPLQRPEVLKNTSTPTINNIPTSKQAQSPPASLIPNSLPPSSSLVKTIPQVKMSSPMTKQPTTIVVQQQQASTSSEHRKKITQEIREQLDLLKEFEGVIPEEDLKRKKRELFLSLPSIPAPEPSPYHQSMESNENKRMKFDDDEEYADNVSL